MSENPETNKLIQQCTMVKQVIEDSMKWVQANVEKDKQAVTIYNLKKLRRDAKRYENALPKRPSVAIFGQSQVGKSYLVSNLAKTPEALSLFVKVPDTGEEVDFIANINPPGGGKEATGLVSRFTTNNTWQSGYKPYLLRLFSQADLVKIISNGYLSDITHYTYAVNREEIQKEIQALASIKQNSPCPGFSEDEVYDVKEYCNNNFRDHFIIKDLNNINFWDDIASIIPYVDSAQRYKVFEIIWGKQPFFTELFKKLSDGLRQLNFLSEIRTELDALTPQQDTILDVERLRELYKDAKKPPVKCYDGGNLLATLDRSILSALTAEVVLPLADSTATNPKRSFLKEADVLDFPGARSRQQIPEVTFEEKDNNDKLLVFLRGKIAFLFNRYNFNYEISTLLFCMDDKQPEVADLPKFLYEWIRNTHGGSPEKRAERERKLALLVQQNDIEKLIPLLVVFTKFNIELAGNPATERPGELGPHNAKWTARIGANFADQMGISVGDLWIQNWDNNGPFKNVFPLRDPKWSKSFFDGIDTDGRENQLRPEYVQKFVDMKNAWVNHKDVIAHVHNPLECWEEFTQPNKSGIDYIIKYMTPTCNPIIKREQIKAGIDELRQDLYDELSAFYQGGNIDEKLKKARISSTQAFMALMKMQKDKNTFGNFLDCLTITDDLSWKIYFDLMMNKQIEAETAPIATAKPDQKTVDIDMLEMLGQFITIDPGESAQSILSKLKEYFGIDDNNELKKILDETGINIETLLEEKKDKEEGEIKDRAHIFAENLLSRWLEYIEEIKDDNVLLQLGLNKKIADLIINEINKNKNRINLKKIIADSVREHVENFQLTSNVDIVARISAVIINKFVNSLGWDYVPQAERPKVKPTDPTPVFTHPPVKSPSKKNLKLEIEFPGEKFFSEWATGLKSSFEANVYFEENVKDAAKAEADAKLGTILDRIKNS
ncbi:MAG: putative virulence factor [Bacteroidales bacterium]|nr:putative virulence factor [Bacteroidales bacterium]